MQLTVSLDNTLNTQSNETGDEFQAELVDPIVIGGDTAVPAGATVHGQLTEVQQPGNVEGRARMTLDFISVEGPGGQTYPVQAAPVTVEADAGTREDLEKIAAGAVLGGIIGGLTEGGKGAAIGAAIGAGAGGVVVVATKGDQLTLEPGQKIVMRITENSQVPVYASK
jgi:hypothetical protein